VTIWDGFRRWFASQGLPFDYVLYSNYERQVEDLVDGKIHAAWNSPLAWVRAERLAQAAGREVKALSMRDSDRDLTSVVAVRADSDVESVADLKGRVVATGAVDSPQATLIPLAHLASVGGPVGLEAADFAVRRFDVGVGLHGDHIGGERDAVAALAAGEVDAACMIDANLLAFAREGTIAAGQLRVLTQTGPYDHCNMTVIDTAPGDLVEHFGRLLASMDYADPTVRPLLDLEGLKQWEDGRVSGYALLAEAVDRYGFYDPHGEVTAAEYAP
jgi:ABC-type phosphate/phosphonate transport system substrate-binding protein